MALGVGYVAGLLTAPKSGKETRKDIEEKLAKARREAEKKLKYLLSELDEVLATAKTASAEAVKVAGKEWDKAVDNAKAAKERVRQLLTSIHEGESKNDDLDKPINHASAAVNHLKKYLKEASKAAK